jgi:hypothetical protein
MANQHAGGPRKKAGHTTPAIDIEEKQSASTTVDAGIPASRNNGAGKNKAGFRSYRLSSDRQTFA